MRKVIRKVHRKRDDAATRNQTDYSSEVFGRDSPRKPATEPAIIRHTIAITLPDITKIKEYATRERLKKLLLIVGALLLILLAGQLLIGFIKKFNKPSVDLNNIAPGRVYAPTALPEGYSVGSASDKLSNGSTLYTVYDSKGREITVSQQAKPTDLNLSMFENALRFDAPLGKAFILEDKDRITGYLLTEQTLILFNSTAGVNSGSLRPLIEAYKP